MKIWFNGAPTQGRNQQYASFGDINGGAIGRNEPMMGDPTGSLASGTAPPVYSESTGRYLFRNLRVRLDAGPGGVRTVSVTLVVNGVSTALIASVQGAAIDGSNLINSVKVKAGDTVNWLIFRSNGTVTTKAHIVWEEVPY